MSGQSPTTDEMSESDYAKCMESKPEQGSRTASKAPPTPSKVQTSPPKTFLPKPGHSTFAEDSDILRLIPMNLAAREAFHELIDKKEQGLIDEPHKPYIVRTGQGPSRQKKKSMSEAPPVWHEGYFRIGFDCPTVVVGLKWALGKASIPIFISCCAFHQNFLYLHEVV